MKNGRNVSVPPPNPCPRRACVPLMRVCLQFEYVSGEDPVLGSIMVAPIVTGIQKNVMSISKHYIMNNQEYDRTSSNEVVDEKTLMELYVPPFGAAAKANTSGFMCSYNVSLLW